ncbi:hypothetical protein SUGI_1178960 [Cryptomeria japonica]|nr:hypothetical protein SUGI_1178960 [Cryptomeria japonica]
MLTAYLLETILYLPLRDGPSIVVIITARLRQSFPVRSVCLAQKARGVKCICSVMFLQELNQHLQVFQDRSNIKNVLIGEGSFLCERLEVQT